MTCDQADELLSDLIDDEISDPDRDALMQHLGGCEACASSLKQMRRSVRFVRAHSGVTLREGTPGAQYMEFTRTMMRPDSDLPGADLAHEHGYLETEDKR